MMDNELIMENVSTFDKSTELDFHLLNTITMLTLKKVVVPEGECYNWIIDLLSCLSGQLHTLTLNNIASPNTQLSFVLWNLFNDGLKMNLQTLIGGSKLNLKTLRIINEECEKFEISTHLLRYLRDKVMIQDGHIYIEYCIIDEWKGLNDVLQQQQHNNNEIGHLSVYMNHIKYLETLPKIHVLRIMWHNRNTMNIDMVNKLYQCYAKGKIYNIVFDQGFSFRHILPYLKQRSSTSIKFRNFSLRVFPPFNEI